MFPMPLCPVKWLADNISSSDVVVLDATITKVGQTELPDEARTVSIPNARFFDLKVFKDLDAPFPNTIPQPDYFSEQARKVGINNDSQIVIYDHHGIYSSPRAWWLCRAMGHNKVSVLDGGFPAWKAEGLSTEPTTGFAGRAGDFTANYQPQLFVDSQEVLDSIGDSNIAILDARSAGRFHGTAPEPRANVRSGHIPGSQSLPYGEILNGENMHSREVLQEMFGKLDVEGKRIVTSCGSGITACVLALGAAVAGHDDHAVFDGSWTEWGDGETFPVEK
jgi:thiosulfate/3-mercaptopyruvate sulfurtransferase